MSRRTRNLLWDIACLVLAVLLLAAAVTGLLPIAALPAALLAAAVLVGATWMAHNAQRTIARHKDPQRAAEHHDPAPGPTSRR